MENDFDYKILVNDEGQYSIWPEMKSAPIGWKETGPVGSKEEVLGWVKTNWLDMRPASLRSTPAS
jgi:MbtH protein